VIWRLLTLRLLRRTPAAAEAVMPAPGAPEALDAHPRT